VGFVLLQVAAAKAPRRAPGRLCRGCGLFFATEDGNRGFDKRGGKGFVAGAVDILSTGGASCRSDIAVALDLY
jgi:hypothetical protein